MWQQEYQDQGRDGAGPAAGKSWGGQEVTGSRGHGDPSAARGDVSTARDKHLFSELRLAGQQTDGQ